MRLSKAYLQARAVHAMAAAAEKRTFTDKIEHLVSANGRILEEKIYKIYKLKDFFPWGIESRLMTHNKSPLFNMLGGDQCFTRKENWEVGPGGLKDEG